MSDSPPPSTAPDPNQPDSAADQPTAAQPSPTSDTSTSSPTANTQRVPEEVTVIGTKPKRVPGAVQIVSSKTLERFNYDDPHAVMQLVPGLYVRQDDGVGLRPNIGIRGAAADRSKKITLMEDGVPFAPAPYSAPAAYYFPVFARAYQMRVVKGPAAIAYGPQTIGGAIDLITRPIPASAQGAIELAGGDYGYGKLHGYFGASDERTGYLLEGVHLRNDGFKELPNGADTGFYRNEWMWKGIYKFAPHSERVSDLSLKLTYSEELSNETYLGLTDADFRKNPLARYGASALDRMRWYRTGVALVHRVEPVANVRITTTLYRNDFWRRWRKVNGFRGAQLFDVLQHPDTATSAPLHALLTGQSDSSSPAEAILIGPNERNFVSQGLMTRVELRTHSGPVSHQIEYGIRLHHDRAERRHSEDGFLLVGGELIPDGTPTTTTAFNEGSTVALSMHAFDAATWGRLTVTPGLRVELSHGVFRDRANGTRSGGANQSALPGIGAFYSLTDELGVLAGVYRGMSPPPPEHDIAPEFSVNYEAGLRYARGPARAEAIAFYDDYSNLTSICTYSSGCAEQDVDRQFSAGRARIYGFESIAEHELPIGIVKLPLRASYTLTFTEFRDRFASPDPTLQSEDTPTREVRPGDEMAYVPKHQAFVSAGVEHRLAGGHVAANYVARMREFAGSKPLDAALVTDAQFTVDLGAYYRPFDWLKLHASVRNLFDQAYIVSRRPFGARPNAPRWIQVGAKFAF